MTLKWLSITIAGLTFLAHFLVYLTFAFFIQYSDDDKLPSDNEACLQTDLNAPITTDPDTTAPVTPECEIAYGWDRADLLRTVIPLSGGYVAMIVGFALRHRSHWPGEFARKANGLYATLAIMGPLVFGLGALTIWFLHSYLSELFGEAGQLLPNYVAALAAVSAALQGPFVADLFGERAVVEEAEEDMPRQPDRARRQVMRRKARRP
ncbi:MAG: hypothetical protein GYB36_03635 [Alphaproteobacteria bacterium]|nr:hypothetical protein [Alphaproteobacteria bacterium]